MGFKRFIEKPILEKDFLNVMGNVLNDYSLHFLSYEEQNYTMQAAEPKIYYNSTQTKNSTFSKDSIFLSGNRKSESSRIMLDDILYLELLNKIIRIHFENGSTKTMRTSLKYFKDRLPKEKFQKINRNTIINIDKMMKMNKSKIILKGEIELETSRVFKQNVRQFLE